MQEGVTLIVTGADDLSEREKSLTESFGFFFDFTTSKYGSTPGRAPRLVGLAEVALVDVTLEFDGGGRRRRLEGTRVQGGGWGGGAVVPGDRKSCSVGGLGTSIWPICPPPVSARIRSCRVRKKKTNRPLASRIRAIFFVGLPFLATDWH